MNKKLKYVDVMGLVVGSIIGWGSFTLPGTKFLKESGLINTFIGLFLGGILVMTIQYAYHIMMKNHSQEGGEYTYTLENLGEGHGFLVAWSLVLCYLSMIPLNASAFVLLLRAFLKESLNVGYLYHIVGYPIYITDIVIMIVVIGIFAMINIKGLFLSSRIQNIMSLLLVIIVLGLLFAVIKRSDIEIFYNHYIRQDGVKFGEISKVLAIVPFLFVGFDVVPQVAKDLGFKPSKSTLLVVLSVFIGIVIYASLNLIAAMSFSRDEVLKTSWAVADSIILKAGKPGFYLMLFALGAAVIGGINGFMIASSKLIASLSLQGHLPKVFSYYSKRRVYPYAIWLVSAIGAVTSFWGRQVILYIVDMSSLLAAIAYAYVSFIGIKRSKKKISKFLSLLGMMVSIGFILLLLLPVSPAHLKKEALIFLLLWMLAGIFVYIRYRKRQII
ncbi:MAG TPA: APC family permease [Lachnospiraceae bacterium]